MSLFYTYPESYEAISEVILAHIATGQTPQECSALAREGLQNARKYLSYRPNIKALQTKQAEQRRKQRKEERFFLRWGTCAGEIVIGWATLAKMLKYKESTLAVLFSKGRGTISLARDNPEGRLDTLDITRTAKPAKPKRGRPVGSMVRPRKTEATKIAELKAGPTGNKLRAIAHLIGSNVRNQGDED